MFCVRRNDSDIWKNGYLTDASIQKISRHIRIFSTFEGTNDKLRLAIVVAGLEYPKGLSKDLQKAMNNPVADGEMIFREGNKDWKCRPSGPSLGV
jgi:hypothetical protein